MPWMHPVIVVAGVSTASSLIPAAGKGQGRSAEKLVLATQGSIWQVWRAELGWRRSGSKETWGLVLPEPQGGSQLGRSA